MATRSHHVGSAPSAGSALRLLCLLTGACAASTADRQQTDAAAPSGEERALLLRAPFAVPRASFFHAALLVPELETADTLPAGVVHGRLSTNHVSSQDVRVVNGFENKFEGLFHEWIAAEVQWGLASWCELSARTAYGGWDETTDRFGVLDESGNPIVRFEELLLSGIASQRHDNITRLDLGAKLRLFEGDTSTTSLSVAGKLPIAPGRDLSNAGTFDLGVTGLETVKLGSTTLHAAAGIVAPLGNQNLFNASADVELNPFVHGALGITWAQTEDLALGLQVEANTSAFRDVKPLRGSPVELVGGVRHTMGCSLLELALGMGLNDGAYDFGASLAFGYTF